VLTIIAALALLTADAHRGRVLGLASAAFSAVSAAALVFVAWLADQPSIGPARAVSLCGAIGLVVIAVLRAVWPTEALRRASR
jgi:hypothetical protein